MNMNIEFTSHLQLSTVSITTISFKEELSEYCISQDGMKKLNEPIFFIRPFFNRIIYLPFANSTFRNIGAYLVKSY